MVSEDHGPLTEGIFIDTFRATVLCKCGEPFTERAPFEEDALDKARRARASHFRSKMDDEHFEAVAINVGS